VAFFVGMISENKRPPGFPGAFFVRTEQDRRRRNWGSRNWNDQDEEFENVRFHENLEVLEMTLRTALCCCCCCTITPIEGRVPTSR